MRFVNNSMIRKILTVAFVLSILSGFKSQTKYTISRHAVEWGNKENLREAYLVISKIKTGALTNSMVSIR